MKLVYGFSGENNDILIDKDKSKIVVKIFELYLDGCSLAGIVNYLKEHDILSPTGKESWSRASIDKMLSNKKYLAGIISVEVYTAVQFEKDNRSNTNDNKTRKTTRYNSENVLSGLLICECCGKNYRRITRASGEVVWRCADKVENGKKALCSNGNSVSDNQIKETLTEQQGRYNSDAIKAHIQNIVVSKQDINVVTF